MIEISKFTIFKDDVFSFNLPNFNEWQKQIKDIVLVEDNEAIHNLSSKPEKRCNVIAQRTAWNSHQRYSALQLLCDQIKKYLQLFAKNENYDIPVLKTHECWINWYSKGDYSQPHTHGSNLSVVIFIDVKDTDAKFFFHSNRNMVLVKKHEKTINFSNLKEINVKDGTVLFFDGSLQHSVNPNNLDKKRITVAINYEVSYDENRK